MLSILIGAGHPSPKTIPHQSFQGDTGPIRPLEGEQRSGYNYYKEYIHNREIVEFCSNRVLIRNFIISNPTARDDRSCNDLPLALREVGVLVEARTALQNDNLGIIPDGLWRSSRFNFSIRQWSD